MTRSGKQRPPIAHDVELFTTLDTVPDPLIVMDTQRSIRAFGRTAEEFLAHPAAAAAGGDTACVLPDGRAAIRHTATMAHPRVVKAVRADGSGVTVGLRIGGPAPCGDAQPFVLMLRDVGLLIRTIVKRHGGHITGGIVPGGGACFRFIVPSAAPGERAVGG